MTRVNLMDAVTWEDMYQDDSCNHIPAPTTLILSKRRSALAALSEARRLTVEKHGAQKYGHLPYVAHLDDVVRVGVSVWPEIPVQYLLSLQLHDVIEDCDMKEEDVAEEFGTVVGSIVKGVSNDPELSREEKSLALNKKLSGLDIESDVGFGNIFVKKCDRFANVYRLISSSGMKKLKVRYCNEYPEFRAAILREAFLDSAKNKDASAEQVVYMTLLGFLDEVHEVLKKQVAQLGGQA